jgi:hypothetical protein
MHRGYARSRRPNTRVGVCELSWRGFEKEGRFMLIWAIFSSGGFLLAVSSEKETQILLSSKSFEMLRIVCKTSIPCL